MASPKFAMIARRLKLNAEKVPAPTPATDDLAAAIQALVHNEIEAAMAQQPESPQQSRRLRALLQEPPQTLEVPKKTVAAPQKPSAPLPTVYLQRDSLGRTSIVSIGRHQFRIQRGVDGHAVAMVPIEDAAEVSYEGKPVLPAPLNRRD